MTSKDKATTQKVSDQILEPSSSIPNNFADLDQLLGYPSLLREESAEDFDALLNHLIKDIEPQGVIEFIYVRDFATYTFEIERLRLHRNLLLDLMAPEAIDQMRSRHNKMSVKCAISGPPWTDFVDKATQIWDLYLADQETRGSLINAQSFALVIDDMEKIERMIGLAEERRMRLVREIDRRHALLKSRLQEAIKNRDSSFSFAQGKSDIIPPPDRPLS